jgi:hypothetical protein
MGQNVIPKNKLHVMAEVVASIITDGHIQVRKFGTRTKFGYVGFFSEDIWQLKRFERNAKSLMRVNPKIMRWGRRFNGRSTGCIINSVEFTKLLLRYGAPYGSKVNRIFYLPKWIKRGNTPVVSGFLRNSFDCDGCINYDKSCNRWEIKYVMYKERTITKNCLSYLENMRKLLSKYGIRTYRIHLCDKYVRPRDGKRILGWRIMIREKASILNYSKFIGFNIKEKREKLRKAVKWARA